MQTKPVRILSTPLGCGVFPSQDIYEMAGFRIYLRDGEPWDVAVRLWPDFLRGCFSLLTHAGLSHTRESAPSLLGDSIRRWCRWGDCPAQVLGS